MLCSWYICPLLARDSCLPSIAWKVHTNSPVLKATHLTSKVYPEANCRTTEIKLEWGLMKTISRCWFELCLYNVFCRSENDNESFSTQWACSWIEELCFSATFPWITNLTAIKYSNTNTLLESSILTPACISDVTIHVVRRVRPLCNIGRRRGGLWLPADATWLLCTETDGSTSVSVPWQAVGGVRSWQGLERVVRASTHIARATTSFILLLFACS